MDETKEKKREKDKLEKEVKVLEERKKLLSLKITKDKAKESWRKFDSEFKKSLNTAIVAAFSFLIALAWKDLITVYVNSLSQISPLKGQIVSALIVTLI